MTKTVNVVPPRTDETGVCILRPEDFTFVSTARTEKRGRTHHPTIFCRTSEHGWELYVCVYHEGEFRRLEMPLTQARTFLADQLTAVIAKLRKLEQKEEESR